MYERFTERARQVVVLARESARTLKHNYIGTEHILLGLLAEEEGLAAQVLESLGTTEGEVRAEVKRVVGQGTGVVEGVAPLTPRAKKVLELALREALSLGHNYIGTEHILLGLVRENEGVAACILLDADIDPEKVRSEIIRVLSGKPRTTTFWVWHENGLAIRINAPDAQAAARHYAVRHGNHGEVFVTPKDQASRFNATLSVEAVA